MIRIIERSDVPECVSVIRESFLTVADELGFTPDNAPRFTAFATTADRLYYQLDNEQRLMCAWYAGNGSIVGYYSLLMQEGGECELNNLCVLPEHRHGGIGKALLEDAYARAKAGGRSKINIGIVEENKVLRRWYEHNGFVHTGTRKFDFFPFTCGYMEKSL